VDPFCDQIHPQPLGGGIESRAGEAQNLRGFGDAESTGLEGLQQESALEGPGRLIPGAGLEYRSVQLGSPRRLPDLG
jgi:hypothetical protein